MGIKTTSIALAIITPVIGIGTFCFSLFAAKVPLEQSLFVTIISELLTLQIDLFVLLYEASSSIHEAVSRAQRALGGEIVEALTGEKEILQKAEGMIQSLKKENGEVLAMWCIMQYNKALKEYFSEFKGKRVCRLVNMSSAGADNVRHHLMMFIDDIKSGNYKVCSTNHSGSEVLIVKEANKAELLQLIPHVVAGKLYRGIYTTDVHTASAYIKDFESLLAQGNVLHIPSGTSNDAARKLIDTWIRSV